MSSDSDETIMSVAELIDNAFGDPKVNVVHHKLLHTVLYLLARQLRVLERRVVVQIGPLTMTKSSSSLSVTEVKLHAMSKKRKKTRTKSRIDTTGDKTGGIGGEIKSDKARQIKAPHRKSIPDKTFDKTLSVKTDKTLSDKATTDKSSTSKSTTDKTSSDLASTDKSSKSKSTTEKTSSDMASTDKTSTSKSTTDKTSSDQAAMEIESRKKDTTDKTALKSTSKIGLGQTSLAVTSSKGSDGKHSTVPARDTLIADAESRNPQEYQKLLEQVEEMRERELRVIHQRADSREEHEKTPTPIASLDSVEAAYEKLLVVERIPAEEAKARAAREKSGAQSSQSGPRLSIVTQKEFQELAFIVRQLQEKYGPVATPGFPENAQLMNELRKGASLTDAMAALQLSARLEAAEKTLQNLLSLVTEIASQTSDLNITSAHTDDIEVIFGAPGDKTRQPKSQAKFSTASRKQTLSKKGIGGESHATGSPSQMSFAVSVPKSTPHMDAPGTEADDFNQEAQKNRVSYEELDAAMQELYDDIMKKVTSSIARSKANADAALKMSSQLEKKIESSLNLENRMEDLENLVATYVEQINVLDTGLSSQMTNYQEELTQMQHDLEVGLEAMADALANTGGDATAVAELNAHFSDLQGDIDDTVSRQKELRDIQSVLAMDLDALRKQIEVLREIKCDREEVIDALRDKAGLGALNGLVSHQQFNAVRGDLEKRIGTAYDKFNNQEIVWQKAIDDLLRELNEKADLVQVDGLRNEIYRYLVEFRNKVKFIMDIVGEPNAAALSKKLNRDTACLSCAAPAYMKPEEPRGVMLPAMSPPTVGTRAPKPKEDGDHGVCIPGQPVPHPIDPRSHVCQRWCGGSHTVMKNNVLSRAPPGVIITSAKGTSNTERGADGKMYAVDKPRQPCSQCVLPPSPVQSELQEQPGPAEGADDDSVVLPYHMCTGYVSYSDPEIEDLTPLHTSLDCE